MLFRSSVVERLESSDEAAGELFVPVQDDPDLFGRPGVTQGPEPRRPLDGEVVLLRPRFRIDSRHRRTGEVFAGGLTSSPMDARRNVENAGIGHQIRNVFSHRSKVG